MASSQLFKIFVLSVVISSAYSQTKGHFHFSQNGFTVFPPPHKSQVNALDYTLEANGKTVIQGKLGLALPDVAGRATETCDPGTADQCYEWGDFATLKITTPKGEDNCATIEWSSAFGRRLEDCFDLVDGVHWYGGAETRTQSWPIEGDARKEHPYVTGDFLQDFQFGGLMETYWLTSSGVALHVAEESPLFTSWNTTHQGQFCLVAQDRAPYTERADVRLKYDLCVPKTGENFKDVHVRSLNRYYKKPSGLPDEKMIVHPFWSTWAQYKEGISQEIVMEMAQRLVEEGYTNNSHIEIDDHWETCYGEAEFNPIKFPDPAKMTRDLAALGIERTTLWIHPFINFNCPSFDSTLLNGYFIPDTRDKPTIVSWWQGPRSGAIDFTNDDAINWWRSRLEKLQTEYNITSFKFDAGEAFWLAPSTKLNGNSDLLPNLYSTRYVEAVSAFGGMAETRTAHRTQELPIFIRFLDKDSRWDNINGLRSMIPSLLLFSVLGYSFTLPDMIGGNAYGTELPSTELYIRWAQANVFMPSWQFSVQPWDFDPTGTVDRVVLEAVKLRERHASQLLAAARQSVVDGTPMNRPMWWVDPEDPVTLNIDDQFMLGDDILVAPVVYEGAVSRNIYLPKGDWAVELADGGSQIFTGPRWLQDWPAPIDVLPYFTRQN